MMNRMEELRDIIKNNLTYTWGKLYLYPTIPDKINARITRTFDSNINLNHVVAYIDTTITNNGKTGIVFTTTGAYFKTIIKKPFYFNYKDIGNVTIYSDKKGNKDSADASLELTFSNGSKLSIEPGSFNKSDLASLLLQLKSKVSSYSDAVYIKSAGEVGKVSLTDNQQKICHGIIHSAAVACGGVGAGIAQLPLVDTAIITPIQIGMVIALGKVFGMRVTESVAKGIIAGAGASIAGRGAVQVIIGWVPLLGNAINTATAAGLTEAIGWMAVAHFYDIVQKDQAKYKVAGMKQGYAAASEEYEAKLRQQADLFIEQQKVYKEEIELYEKLLDEYEAYIRKMEAEQTTKNLPALRTQFNQLKTLRVG